MEMAEYIYGNTDCDVMTDWSELGTISARPNIQVYLDLSGALVRPGFLSSNAVRIPVFAGHSE